MQHKSLGCKAALADAGGAAEPGSGLRVTTHDIDAALDQAMTSKW